MDSPQPPPPPGAWPPPPGSPQPYAPPPAQQPWAPARPPFSGMAVAAFVTSLFVLFPLALVLGLIALSRLTDGDAQQRRQRGKGLAIAAVALASVQIAVLAVVVPVAVFNAEDEGGSATAASQDDRPGEDAAGPSPTESDEPEGPDEPTPAPGDGAEEIDVYSIGVGDCFDSGTGLDRFQEDEATEEFRVTRLACDGAHEAEAFGSTRVTGYEAFPGDEELTRVAAEECGGLVQPYVLDVWNLDSSVTYFFYYPQQSGWAYGDREILCFFGHQDGSPLTGSLRGDASGFSEEQTRYLEITARLEAVIWQEPAPGAALDEHRSWAGEMSRTITEEADALSRASWSAEVSGLVDDLVAARGESVPHWDRAADAAGQAEYDTHYGDGYATLGVETEISIREALGLTTSLQ
ncbi:septum formation family protein [Streptomyces sp. 6N223]|uniref:septum formation family protein n=1 Tax=Streptomyces sp. 6N223 TaxID=3457412 RepID=UPI003FD15D32